MYGYTLKIRDNLFLFTVSYGKLMNIAFCRAIGILRLKLYNIHSENNNRLWLTVFDIVLR